MNRIVDLQRAPRCGHVWVAGIDTTLSDGLKEPAVVRVRDIGGGNCPICKTPSTVDDRGIARAGYGEAADTGYVVRKSKA